MDVAPDVELRLGALPESLESTYTEIYQRIESQKGSSPQLAKRALSWVMCSCRPFSPDDLVTAVSFGFAASGLDTRSLFKICHNLIALDREQNIVRFAHLSVREFLEKSQFTMVAAHTLAATSCISYLREPETISQIGALVARINESASYPPPLLPVLAYPMIYWITHVQRCQDQDDAGKDDLSILLLHFLKKSYTDWYTTWKSMHTVWRTEGPLVRFDDLNFKSISPLQLVCVFGIRGVLTDLWDSGLWDINALNGSGASAMVIAAKAGFLRIVETLLEKGADVNAQGGYFGNALQAAASRGQEDVVELLLNAGANVNAHCGEYGNALQAAAKEGHEKLVELLIHAGANVHARGESSYKHGRKLSTQSMLAVKVATERIAIATERITAATERIAAAKMKVFNRKEEEMVNHTGFR